MSQSPYISSATPFIEGQTITVHTDTGYYTQIDNANEGLVELYLSAINGSGVLVWGSPTILSYDPYNNHNDHSGTYTLPSDAVGFNIRATVAFSDYDIPDTNYFYSSLGEGIVYPATPSSGTASITGTTRQNQTLTCSTSWSSTKANLYNVTYNFKWYRAGGTLLRNYTSAASSSTSSSDTYVLTSNEIASTVYCVVTATNVTGTGSVTSASTGTITPIAPSSATASISGTTKEGNVLTCTSGVTAYGTSSYNLTYNFKWYRAGGTLLADNTPAATSSTSGVTNSYTTVAADVGSGIYCVVTVSNVTGSTNVTSSTTSNIIPNAPVNTGAPTLSGTSTQGSTLSTTNGSWSATNTGTYPISYTYQWKRNGVDISGATSSTYQLTNLDINQSIKCTVTATNAGGSTSADTVQTGAVAYRAPVNSVSPSLSGTTTQGSTLTCSTGTWQADSTYYTAPTSYTYQWYRGAGTTISGATSSTYTLSNSDIGTTVYCIVTATNAGGSTTAQSSASSTIATRAPVVISAASITGTPTQGSTLTCSSGSWQTSSTYYTAPSSYSYQWYRGASTVISGATASTYQLTNSDIGTTVYCIVTATNAGGNSTSQASATATVATRSPVNTVVPSISGTVQVSQTLTGTDGTWETSSTYYTAPASYSYQWKRGGSAISGATSSTYVVQPQDVGSTLTLTVTATNAGGSTEATSAATSVVLAAASFFMLF